MSYGLTLGSTPMYYGGGLLSADPTQFSGMGNSMVTGYWDGSQWFGQNPMQGAAGSSSLLGGIMGGGSMGGGGLMGMLGGIGSLLGAFNQYRLGQDYMDIMREQLGMAKEQWQMTKDEIARISGVRNKLNAQYSGSGTPAGTAATANQAG